ncbi:cation:proton antiporter [Pyrococcus furiosus DSM 3638]|uniref:Cation:proton antiporter n=3 Tax=Pyrococcus furiosus TaxID=2261 RepID=A0A5C0XMR7_PYRFU|nr:cation:proton antiporter [Pyrococcus furiosus]AAL80399.1 Na+/H+ antiporter [Pyrococcus furiosus DSM 3638]AFN03062.1 Na+/H+ antiporter [Pyrococcus furiosus COM1]QEK77992.1 cation:proton antiporter [Pyrococcus furiosus DSM 3638]
MDVFLELALILIMAKIFGYISVRFGFPAALGQLIGGIIIGPSLLNIVPYSEEVRLLAELGVVILLFLAGLETDVEEFKKVGFPAFIVAILGVFVPFVLGYASALAFGYPNMQALFLGGVLTATSVGLTTSILMEMKKLRTKVGTTILAAAVIDDVLGIIVLTILVAISTRGSVNLFDLGIIFLEVVVFFTLGLLLGNPAVKEMLKLSERITLPETVTAFAISIMLLFAYIAEKFQLAGITGSYLAGILVAMTEEAREITNKIMTIGYSLFIPIFLVSIGIESDLHVLLHASLFAIVYAVVGIVGKVVGCSLGALLVKFKPKEALQVGVGMIPRMEVALIMANIGLREGVFTRDVFSIPVVMVVVTTLVTPFLLKLAFSK